MSSSVALLDLPSYLWFYGTTLLDPSAPMWIGKDRLIFIDLSGMFRVPLRGVTASDSFDRVMTVKFAMGAIYRRNPFAADLRPGSW
jgi:hypothetical protein